MDIIFHSIWTFLGTCILVETLCMGIAKIITALRGDE